MMIVIVAVFVVNKAQREDFTASSYQTMQTMLGHMMEGSKLRFRGWNLNSLLLCITLTIACHSFQCLKEIFCCYLTVSCLRNLLLS